MSRLLISLILLLSSINIFASEELIEIKTSRGVSQKYLIDTPETDAKAIVLLFAGGKGALNLSTGLFGNSIGWGKQNFLVRDRESFKSKGFVTVTVDAPSDRQTENGMYYEFRTSIDHVSDIDDIINQVKKKHDLPVWIIGTSRGTESAAYIAIKSKVELAGVILTSSMTEENRKGIAVPDLPLYQIKIPTLITHHENDRCKWTQPSGAKKIYNLLTAAPVKDIKFFSGGREQSKPCKALSYHGYLDIEDEVIDYIANFIQIN